MVATDRRPTIAVLAHRTTLLKNPLMKWAVTSVFTAPLLQVAARLDGQHIRDRRINIEQLVIRPAHTSTFTVVMTDRSRRSSAANATRSKQKEQKKPVLRRVTSVTVRTYVALVLIGSLHTSHFMA